VARPTWLRRAPIAPIARHCRRSERAVMVPAAATTMRGLGYRAVALPLIMRRSGLPLSSGPRAGFGNRPAAPIVVSGLAACAVPQAQPVRAGGAMRSAESAARRPDRAAAAAAAAR
jgi:hypothetical protein